MSCHHPVAKPLRLHHQDVVVANMLQSYKREAKLVFPATPRGWAAIEVEGAEARQVRTQPLADADPAVLNATLAAEVARLHAAANATPERLRELSAAELVDQFVLNSPGAHRHCSPERSSSP